MRNILSSLTGALKCSTIMTAFLSLSLSAMPVTAQESRKIVLDQGQFQESYLEKVTVSGGIRAGFMQQSLLPQIDLQQLYIQVLRDIPEPKAKLCVNMVSRDGLYAASWHYALGSQPAGELLVSIPSKFQKQISGYAPDALVVLAAIGEQDCTSGDLRYVPASWGPANNNNYVLYVNSGNTDTSVGIPGMAERGACTKISADSTVAYDTACMVNKELLVVPKSLYLLRNNFGKRLPNVEVPVR
ncbi:MAG: hypothetical protein AB7F61_12325 [Desulfobulbus sp.]